MTRPKIALIIADDDEEPATSQDLLDVILAAADGDDFEVLRSCKTHIDEVLDHVVDVRDLRLAAAQRLRDGGVAMEDIADAAGVSPSYLTRRILAAGGTRRTGQRAPRERP